MGDGSQSLQKSPLARTKLSEPDKAPFSERRFTSLFTGYLAMSLSIQSLKQSGDPRRQQRKRESRDSQTSTKEQKKISDTGKQTDKRDQHSKVKNSTRTEDSALNVRSVRCSLSISALFVHRGSPFFAQEGTFVTSKLTELHVPCSLDGMSVGRQVLMSPSVEASWFLTVAPLGKHNQYGSYFNMYSWLYLRNISKMSWTFCLMYGHARDRCTSALW